MSEDEDLLEAESDKNTTKKKKPTRYVSEAEDGEYNSKGMLLSHKRKRTRVSFLALLKSREIADQALER